MKKCLWIMSLLLGGMWLSFVLQAQALTITFAWDAPPPIVGVTVGYHLYRGLQANCSDCVKLNPVPVTTLTVQDVTAVRGVVYYYAVTAVPTTGSTIPTPWVESIKSNIVKADLTLIPLAPPNFKIVIIIAVP